MLFTVASSEWSAGHPLPPTNTQVGLFRTREAASRMAAGRPTLALALRHDPARGLVVAQPPAVHALRGQGGWSAPAVVNDQGGVVVFAPIPAALIQLIRPARLRMHPGQPDPVPPPHGASGSLALAGPGRSDSAFRDDRACGEGGDRVH